MGTARRQFTQELSISQNIQCVVTRRWSKRPAAAKINAPVQIDATRRTRGPAERTHSTRDGSLQASSTLKQPPATNNVSRPSPMSRKLWVATSSIPPSVRTGPGLAASRTSW